MEAIQDTNKNTTSTSNPQGKKLGLLALLLAILLVIGGVGGYLWYQAEKQNYERKLAALETIQANNEDQLAALKNENKALKKNNSSTPQQNVASEDERVWATAKNYCNAYVDPKTKSALKFTLGTMMGKKVIYSEDKKFARLNVACHPENVAPNGFAQRYVLKKINGEWIVIVTTQQQVDASDVTNFAIPPSMAE